MEKRDVFMIFCQITRLIKESRPGEYHINYNGHLVVVKIEKTKKRVPLVTICGDPSKEGNGGG